MKHEASTLVNTNSNTTEIEPSFQWNRPDDRASGEASMEHFLQLIKKRGWIVLVAGAVGLALAIAANVVMTRQYTSKAKIEVKGDISGEYRVEQIAGSVAGGDLDAQKIDSEIEIMRSRTLALKTISSLHLDKDPDFIKAKERPWDLSKPGDRALLIDAFLNNLKVSRLAQTDLIEIYVTTKRAELSSLIANTLVDRYIEYSFKESYGSTQKISNWLNQQLDSLKVNLQSSQERMVALEKDLGIVGIGQQEQSVAVTHLAELNKVLVDAQADRMLKESAYRAMLSSSSGVVDALSPQALVLQNAKNTLTQLKAQYSAMIQTYGSAYPPVQALKAQIESQQAEIAREEAAQVARAQKAFDAAQSNENQLRKTLDQEEQNAYQDTSKVIQYELAREEYRANRELYDGIQVRLQEAGILAGLHSTSVHIVEDADIPVFPSQPRKFLNLAVGLGCGLFLGCIVALLLEAVDTNLRTIEDVESSLNLPLLAVLPKVEGSEILAANFIKHALSGHNGSWSKIGEALRGLRTSILLSTAGAPPQILMISSTRPAEGKTSVAILEAIIFALNGSRVLLIDADLRRPAVHLRVRGESIYTNSSHNMGLSSVLSGKATLKEAIQAWPEQPNLHLLLAGPLPPLPSELLGSKQMEDLLTELRKQYDFIFIDTPPVLTVTDASVIGRLADAAVLVVRYGEARRQVIARSVELLQRSGTNLLGVALNMVDFGAPEYSEYYGRQYYNYYGSRELEESEKETVKGR
jgi:polysaccharide biosynthesis transport protein